MSPKETLPLGMNDEARDLALVIRSGDEGAVFTISDVSPALRKWLYDNTCSLLERFQAVRVEDEALANRALDDMWR